MSTHIKKPDIQVQQADEATQRDEHNTGQLVNHNMAKLNVEKEITMEDFLELEEFLELEDREKLEDLDSSREVTMEDFLLLEEWLEDTDQNSEKKLDDDQHTSRGDLETSPKHPPDIDRHPPDDNDGHSWLDELPGYIVELEQVEKRMYMSKASHLAVPKHQRPPIWTEEALNLLFHVIEVCSSVVTLRYHHAIRQVWGKEEEELEEEEKDQGRFSVVIDSSLLRWCQKIQSAQQMLLKAICKASSTPYC
ncbi:hypothetical protein DY000_02007302 [Brassica cretica]|uniref:Uncharacterized protein n=1 Tax=Brassica cretica TaxID=69181 RepID=A0ABQ7C797_BRACR|nr:hypothetical protein DY000_02007302 [Brassica cretica]